MSKNITLENFTVRDFGGISSDKPVILYVGEAYAQGKNIMLTKGDQGTNKSSWLTAILGLMGQELDINGKSKEIMFINRNSGKLDCENHFTFKGVHYRVSWTKSAFKLQRQEMNELTDKLVWRDETSPVATLKAIIGYVGTPPMNLKNKDGVKQVEEIRRALAISDDVQIEERKLLKSLEEAKTARTNANREYTRLQKALEANEMYVNWQQSEEAFKVVKTSASEKTKVDEIAKRKETFTRAQDRVKTLTNDVVKITDDIQELEQKLQEKKLELLHTKDALEKGKVFIEENKGVEKEHEEAQESYFQIEKYLAQQRDWEAVKKAKKEMDEFQEFVIKLDGQKDDLKAKLLDIGKRGLPDIPGLEVVTSGDIDGREVGVYLKGLNAYQLSESEITDLYLQIWGTQDVKYVFLENISSYGTSAINTLNELAKKGVKIFASKMERGAPFEIELVDAIPLTDTPAPAAKGKKK